MMWPLTKAAGRAAVMREFQPDLVEIDERELPWLARSTVLILLATLAIAGLWASLSQIDIVVRARGRIVSVTPPTVLQPMATGAIRDIRVHVNDVVTKGQVLAVLDHTFATADLDAVIARRTGLQAQSARLQAEITGHPFALPKDATPEWWMQKALFDQRAAQFASKLASYNESISRLKETLAAKQEELGKLAQQLTIADEVQEMREKLYSSGSGSRLNLLQAQSTRLDVVRQHGTTSGTIKETTAEIQRVTADRNAFVEEWRTTIADNLFNAERDLTAAREEAKKAERRQELIEITAPFDGIVLEVAARWIGSVVREAEPLVTLVPSNAPLEAEVMIDARDIGFVEVGQEARIKLEAFPFTRHGTVEGVITSIGEDSVAQEQASTAGGTDANARGATPAAGERYFRARIRLGALRLRNLPVHARMGAGVTLTAEIMTGRRKIISYVFDPLVKGFDEGLRER